jgi:hypothetical protein
LAVVSTAHNGATKTLTTDLRTYNTLPNPALQSHATVSSLTLTDTDQVRESITVTTMRPGTIYDGLLIISANWDIDKEGDSDIDTNQYIGVSCDGLIPPGEIFTRMHEKREGDGAADGYESAGFATRVFTVANITGVASATYDVEFRRVNIVGTTTIRIRYSDVQLILWPRG